MDFKSKLKKLFSILENEKFEIEAVLIDGTKVVVEGQELIVGAKVSVVTEEGNIDAPDGEHTLEDGKVIVTEGGLITEIKEVEEQPTETLEIDVEAEMVKQAEINKQVLEAIQMLSDEVTKKIDEAFGEIQKIKDEMATLVTEPIEEEETELEKEKSPSKFSSKLEQRLKALEIIKNNK